MNFRNRMTEYIKAEENEILERERDWTLKLRDLLCRQTHLGDCLEIWKKLIWTPGFLDRDVMYLVESGPDCFRPVAEVALLQVFEQDRKYYKQGRK